MWRGDKELQILVPKGTPVQIPPLTMKVLPSSVSAARASISRDWLHISECPSREGTQGLQALQFGDRGDISASKNAGAHSDPALAGWKEQAELQGGFLITVPSPGIPRSWGCLRDGLLCILSTSG